MRFGKTFILLVTTSLAALVGNSSASGLEAATEAVEAVCRQRTALGFRLRSLVVVTLSLLSQEEDPALVLAVGRRLARTLPSVSVRTLDEDRFCSGWFPGGSGELIIFIASGYTNSSSDLVDPCLAIRDVVSKSRYYGAMTAFVGVSMESVTELVSKEAAGPQTGVLLLAQRESLGGSPTVREIYSVEKGGPVQLTDLLVLRQDEKILTSGSISSFTWKRRGNLQGRQISAITKIWPPFITSVENDDTGQAISSGFYADIMGALAERINFTIVATEATSKQRWNHMVELVANDTFDLGFTGFSQTHSRSLMVEFSLPFVSSSVRLFYKRNKDVSSYLIYFGSFLADSWYALIGAVVTAGVGLATIAFLARKTVANDNNFVLVTSVVYVWFALVGRRFHREPEDAATRVAFVSISLGGFFIICLYRSMLSASLAIKIQQPPVLNLEELLELGFPLLVSKDTSVERYFSEAAPGSIHKSIYDKQTVAPPNMTEPSLFFSMANDFDYANHLLAGVYSPLTTFDEYPCTVSSVPQDYRKVGNGFIFRKNWDLTPIFNYHFLKMLEDGTISELREKWMPPKSTVSCSRTALGERKVQADFFSVVTLFMLWGVGAVAATFVLMWEFMWECFGV